MHEAVQLQVLAQCLHKDNAVRLGTIAGLFHCSRVHFQKGYGHIYKYNIACRCSLGRTPDRQACHLPLPRECKSQKYCIPYFGKDYAADSKRCNMRLGIPAEISQAQKKSSHNPQCAAEEIHRQNNTGLRKCLYAKTHIDVRVAEGVQR